MRERRDADRKVSSMGVVHTIFIGLLTGLLTGGIYALMASGLTLTYGVMRVINVAQGILVILGAYLSYTLSQQAHLDLFAGLLITTPVLFGLGALIQWAFLRRVRGHRTALSILVLFAVAQVIEGGLSLLFTTNSVHLHAWYLDASFQVAGFYVTSIYVFCFWLSVLLLSALFLLVYRTGFGASLRATMQNAEAARLIGIEVERVQTLAFGIGVALAAAGGMAYGATNAFNPASSYDLISRLLVIIVLGGMGSISGALVASVLMLVIGNLTALFFSPTWSTLAFLALLVLLLLVRPQGLFGQASRRRQ
jgi:branched-chain amino acid transport system permease protein